MATRWVSLKKKGRGETLLARVRWCDGFFCKLRGLMFRRTLLPDQGLLLVDENESRLATTIHMLFMFLALGVVWLDASGRVVDTRRAKPWRLIYAPRAPAQYVLEADAAILAQVSIGDELEWVNID